MAARVVHVEFPAQDADREQSFYEGLFGWQFSQPMPEMDYRMVDLGEGQGAAVFPSDSGATGLKVYFGVDDIDAAVGQVRSSAARPRTRCPFPRWAGSPPARTRTATRSPSGSPTSGAAPG